MRTGTVREVKDNEYRVGLTPESVHELTAHGQEVWVESGAGTGIGASDRDYLAAGGVIKPNAADIFAGCDLVVKVKEPQSSERKMLRGGVEQLGEPRRHRVHALGVMTAHETRKCLHRRPYETSRCR